MNLYLITIENKDDVIVEAQAFQSEMSIDEMHRENWQEIANSLGFEVDREDGDTIDIDPIVDPPTVY